MTYVIVVMIPVTLLLRTWEFPYGNLVSYNFHVKLYESRDLDKSIVQKVIIKGRINIKSPLSGWCTLKLAASDDEQIDFLALFCTASRIASTCTSSRHTGDLLGRETILTLFP